MPLNTTPSGASVRRPGVYTAEQVVKSSPGPLPEFQVPIVMVGAEEGYPFNVRDTRDVSETTVSQFKLCKTDTAVKTWFGNDSDAAVVAKYLWRHGFPQGFFVCMSALTRASIVGTSTGPVNQINILGRKYGWPANWIKVSWSSLTLVVQPPVNYSRLTADSVSASDKIYVRDNSWISKGMTLEVGDNDTTTNASKVVEAVGYDMTATGQKNPWVRFTATVGAVYTTSQYAAIACYSPTLKETPAAFGDLEEAFQWIVSSSKYLYATKTGTFNNATLITVASLTCLKNITAWGTMVPGASPAPTATDVSDFITDMNESQWDQFILDNQKVPWGFYLAMSSSTAHASMRDYAAARRAAGSAIAVMFGGAWGDVVPAAGDATDPYFRAAALDSQDCALCIGGLDRLAAYLSFGPAVFARRLEKGIPHNLTHDELVYEEVEKVWDETNSGQITTLLDRGCIVYALNPSLKKHVIEQGLSTLQQNDEAWNEVGATTPQLGQRDNADLVAFIVRNEFDTLVVGSDKVTAGSVAGVLRRKAERLLLKRGLIVSFTINSVTLSDNAAGYDVDWSIKILPTVDYINVTTKILVG
jgi:hypothetical protein